VRVAIHTAGPVEGREREAQAEQLDARRAHAVAAQLPHRERGHDDALREERRVEEERRRPANRERLQTADGCIRRAIEAGEGEAEAGTAGAD